MSGDITALGTIRGGPAVLDMTAINKSAYERIGGLRDGEISFTAWFNDAAGQEHAALKGLPTADVHVAYFRGTTLGNPAACCVAKQVNYDGTRGQDGAFTFAVQALSNAFGLEWGRSLTAGKRTDTANTNGSSIDLGAAKTNGLQAYIQAFSITATTVTATIQESSDDAAADPFAAVTGGAFAAITTAPTSERIATAAGQAVERYLRLATTGTWAGGNIVFAVVVVANDSVVVF